MSEEKNTDRLNVCDECGSTYFLDTSKMANLCPECSHILYGYENCQHFFEDGKCVKCNWDGSTSHYLNNLKGKQNEN